MFEQSSKASIAANITSATFLPVKRDCLDRFMQPATKDGPKCLPIQDVSHLKALCSPSNHGLHAPAVRMDSCSQHSITYLGSKEAGQTDIKPLQPPLRTPSSSCPEEQVCGSGWHENLRYQCMNRWHLLLQGQWRQQCWQSRLKARSSLLNRAVIEP